MHLVSPPRNKSVYGFVPDRHHFYRHGWPGASLLSAISAASATVIVPGDDRVLALLLSLHRQRLGRFGSGDRIAKLIEFSLGDMRSYSLPLRRAALMDEARALGIRALKTTTVTSEASLSDVARILGFPLVLKLDGSTGGAGTVVVHDWKGAELKSRVLLGYRRRIRKKLGGLRRGEDSILGPRAEWQRPVLNGQAYVLGRPATSAFACWNGTLLGAVHFEVLQEAWPNGPATVVRMLRNPELDSNAEKIASRFGLSGIHGLDYMIDDATGIPWLIEMNPRTHPNCPLAPWRWARFGGGACRCNRRKDWRFEVGQDEFGYHCPFPPGMAS